MKMMIDLLDITNQVWNTVSAQEKTRGCDVFTKPRFTKQWILYSLTNPLFQPKKRRNKQANKQTQKRDCYGVVVI